MDSLHHEKLTVSKGLEDHEVHLCHRCGWPFPNPHPSARHRRSHKKVCGTVKGYELIQSKSDDHKLVVSDDDDGTSDEGEHTPSPKIEKEIAPMSGSSGGVGEYSHRSEDDVFSDAITEFLDGGFSPQLEERFEQVKGKDKTLEQKTLEGDLSEFPLEKTDETSGSDLVSPVDKSPSVLLLTDIIAVPVPETHTNGLTSKEDLSRTEMQLDESIDGVNKLGGRKVEEELVQDKQDADMLKREDKLASVALDSEDGKRLDPALVAAKEKKEPCDSSANEVAKVDISPIIETLEKPIAALEEKVVPAEVNGVRNSVEVNGPTKADSHIPIAEETHGNTNSSMGITKASDSAEVVGVTDPREGGKFSPPGNGTRSQEPEDKFGQIVSSSLPEVDIGLRHLEEVSKAEDSLMEDEYSGFQTPLEESKVVSTSDVKGLDSVGLDLKHNIDIFESEKNPAPVSEISIENSGNENNGSKDGAIESDSGDAAEVDAKLNPGIVVLCKTSDSHSLEMQEAKILDQDSPYIETVNTSEDNDSKPANSERCSVSPTLKEPVPSSLGVQVRAENSLTNDESLAVDNKSLKDGGDLQLTKEDDGISELDLSGENFSISDSLEGKCGSVSDKSEINSQAPKTTSEEPYPNKSDVFEPPSFMTLVQPGVNSTSEIETTQQNNQQAGWFPSLTSVVNESEGRKKNEEIIAKVTNWSQGKQQHSPLKNLLSEAKSQSTKETPIAPEAAVKDNTAEKTNVDSKYHQPAGSKEMEKEWDSPARMEIQKEKKKKKSKSFWTPFVCCSSVHRDL